MSEENTTPEETAAAAPETAAAEAPAEKVVPVAIAAALEGKPTPKAEHTRGRQRRLVGRVVNDTKNPGRAKKTVVVEVVRRFRDPFYGKYVKRKKKYHAHDEREEFRTRDLVEIKSMRPMSKTKRWTVSRRIERPPEV